ncbi:hypothetical protein UFOVP510_45 [uncultured Caudovirales phage]|uniref:Uncharacterized protein n=1 Tax=uncultured Caudovirales phage TaxID=2100421 RepID=A0A6J5MM63_9CAUD|nr:hypothetical protein UFOVP510_45 [uncultured Caudovirales phage]
MMSLSSHTFWIDYESGKLVESLNSGTQAKNPTFTQGDTSKVEIHLVRKNGTTREEIAIPAGGTLKFGIGRLETAPTGGSFKLGYKGTATADIAFDATASAIASALNGIPAVASEGGISVAKAGDAFLLTWNTGTTHDALASDPDALFPSSQVILIGQTAGDVQKVLLHLQQSPIAYLETFSNMGSPEITATLIATVGAKKVYRVSISPSPAGGSFIISGTNPTGTIESGSISINATSYDVVNALPSTISTDASVIKSGTYSWDISISSANSLAVDGSGLVGWLGVEGLLSLNTVQIHEFLNAKETAQAVIEIALSEASGQTTLVQADCTIVADLIDDGSIAPLDLTPPLSEGVANNRYIRKDLVSAPSEATQDIIWQNLGVTIDGSDVVDAIDNSSAPSGGNPFATKDDVDAKYDATNPSNYIPEANVDGNLYGRKNGMWELVPSADLTGYATESFVTSQGYLTTFPGITNVAASLTYDDPSVRSTGESTFLLYDSQLGYDVNVVLIATAPLDPNENNYDGYVVGFQVGSPLSMNVSGNLVQMQVPPGLSLQELFNQIAIAFPTWTFSGDAISASYIDSTELSGLGVSMFVNPVGIGSGDPFVSKPSLWLDLKEKVAALGQADKFMYVDPSGVLGFRSSTLYVLSSTYYSGQNLKANLSGCTFTGKVNAAPSTSLSAGFNLGSGVAPATPSAGDLWTAGNTDTLRYRAPLSNNTLDVATRNATNTFSSPNIIDTTSTSSALRITQKGTGSAILVEDATNPDTTAFVVDANGAVGVGVDPATWTATNKVEVVGAIKATSITFNGTSQFKVNGTQSNPTSGNFDAGKYPTEILMSYNGSTYAIPARFISTP